MPSPLKKALQLQQKSANKNFTDSKKSISYSSKNTIQEQQKKAGKNFADSKKSIPNNKLSIKSIDEPLINSEEVPPLMPMMKLKRRKDDEKNQELVNKIFNVKKEPKQ